VVSHGRKVNSASRQGFYFTIGTYDNDIIVQREVLKISIVGIFIVGMNRSAGRHRGSQAIFLITVCPAFPVTASAAMEKIYNRVFALGISGIIIRGRKYPEMPGFAESDTEVAFIGKSLYRAWNEQKDKEEFHDIRSLVDIILRYSGE